MAAPAELLADRDERRVCQLPRQVDRKLSGPGDFRGPARGDELLRGDPEERRDDGLDAGGGQCLGEPTWVDVVEDVRRQLEIDRVTRQRVVRDDPDQRSLECTN